MKASALGRAYATVGPGESGDDAPVNHAGVGGSTRSTRGRPEDEARQGTAVKRGPTSTRAVDDLPPPERWVTWRLDRGSWIEDDREDDNGNNLCSLVPLMNDPRMLGRNRPGKFDQRLGRSLFPPIVSPLDALNKLASDMMVSAEFHALPRRWATGLKRTTSLTRPVRRSTRTR